MSRTVTISQAIELGLQHHRAGQFQQAESIYRQVLQQDPNNFDALQLLGAMAQQLGKSAIAVELLSKALAIDSNAPHAHNNLGQALVGLGRLDEAIPSYRKAISLKPDYREAWVNLGDANDTLLRSDEAVAAFREAIKLAPNDAELCNKLGAALLDVSDADEAKTWLEKSLALNPKLMLAMNNLGRCEQMRGELARAIECYEKVIAAQPTQPEPHLNLALALMNAGEFERGHEEYEWRLQCPAWLAHPKLALPMWNGTDLAGKTLLLHAEQGYGDTFQLIRYAPILVARGARIIAGCRPEARKLIAKVEGVSDTVVPDEPLPQADFYAHLPSIPWLLRTTLDTIPTNVPYIFAEEDRTGVWRERVDAAGGKLSVGITWRGQALPYPNRSFALKAAIALAQVPGVVFHSLQVGEGASEISDPPEGMKIIDHSSELTDFSETAALMANLDVVISIDTASAHLAGAMGLRTFTLLPFASSHQWLRDRNDSPWYPTMRLFRQPKAGDWESVFREVATELTRLLSES